MENLGEYGAFSARGDTPLDEIREGLGVRVA